MKILIAEDDLASRRFITKFMSNYGECDITIDGIEAIEAFIMGLDSNQPYDLLCLDVMMPRVDGIKVLETIREFEKVRGIEESKKAKVIITTALGETSYIKNAYEHGMVQYVCKPIEVDKIENAMKLLGLIQK